MFIKKYIIIDDDGAVLHVHKQLQYSILFNVTGGFEDSDHFA